METPFQNPQPVETMPEKTVEKSIGPAIGIIVIIVLIVLGGLYFWGQRLERQKALPQNVPDQNSSMNKAVSGSLQS